MKRTVKRVAAGLLCVAVGAIASTRLTPIFSLGEPAADVSLPMRESARSPARFMAGCWNFEGDARVSVELVFPDVLLGQSVLFRLSSGETHYDYNLGTLEQNESRVTLRAPRGSYQPCVMDSSGRDVTGQVILRYTADVTSRGDDTWGAVTFL